MPPPIRGGGITTQSDRQRRNAKLQPFLLIFYYLDYTFRLEKKSVHFFLVVNLFFDHFLVRFLAELWSTPRECTGFFIGGQERRA